MKKLNNQSVNQILKDLIKNQVKLTAAIAALSTEKTEPKQAKTSLAKPKKTIKKVKATLAKPKKATKKLSKRALERAKTKKAWAEISEQAKTLKLSKKLSLAKAKKAFAAIQKDCKLPTGSKNKISRNTWDFKKEAVKRLNLKKEDFNKNPQRVVNALKKQWKGYHKLFIVNYNQK